MFTIEDLEKMHPGIFAKGFTTNEPGKVFFTREYPCRELKRVAVRGEFADRTMYFGRSDENEFSRIAMSGDKYSDEKVIQKLLLVDDDFMLRYRN